MNCDTGSPGLVGVRLCGNAATLGHPTNVLGAPGLSRSVGSFIPPPTSRVPASMVQLLGPIQCAQRRGVVGCSERGPDSWLTHGVRELTYRRVLHLPERRKGMSPVVPKGTVAAQLRGALQAALSTLDGAADGTILPEQVSEHLMLWEATFEAYKHRLPDQAQHLGRSVRAALGEAVARRRSLERRRPDDWAPARRSRRTVERNRPSLPDTTA